MAVALFGKIFYSKPCPRSDGMTCTVYIYVMTSLFLIPRHLYLSYHKNSSGLWYETGIIVSTLCNGNLNYSGHFPLNTVKQILLEV